MIFFLNKAPFSKESYLTLRPKVQNTRDGNLGFLLDCNAILTLIVAFDHDITV